MLISILIIICCHDTSLRFITFLFIMFGIIQIFDRSCFCKLIFLRLLDSWFWLSSIVSSMLSSFWFSWPLRRSICHHQLILFLKLSYFLVKIFNLASLLFNNLSLLILKLTFLFNFSLKSLNLIWLSYNVLLILLSLSF